MIINVNAQIVRSAMQCQADKNDVRFFMWGILFAANGDVVASDAHVLFKCPAGFEPPDDWPDTILRFEKQPGISATTLAIDIDGVTGTVTPDKGSLLKVEVVDGTYPDSDRLIKDGSYTEAVTSICLDSRYLSAISKVYPDCTVVFHHGRTEDGPVVIKPAFIRNDAPTGASDKLAAFANSVMLISPVAMPGAAKHD